MSEEEEKKNKSIQLLRSSKSRILKLENDLKNSSTVESSEYAKLNSLNQILQNQISELKMKCESYDQSERVYREVSILGLFK